MHKQKNESHREKGKNMITFVSHSRRMTMEQAGVSETKKKPKKKPKKQLFCQSQITAINLALEFNIFFF